MNRRGVQQWMVLVIIIMATALILFGVFGQVRKEALDVQPIEGCKRSVEAASVIKEGTATLKEIKVRCPRERVLFKDETQDQVNAKIVESIQQCAYKFGSGQVDFGPANKLFHDKACVVCSTFGFVPDSDAQKKYGDTSFEQYVKTRKDSTGKSFADIFKESRLDKGGGAAYQILGQGTSDIFEPIFPSDEFILFMIFEPTTSKDVITGKGLDQADQPSLFVFEKFPKRGGMFNQCERLLN